jgi:hypothetical protein
MPLGARFQLLAMCPSVLFDSRGVSVRGSVLDNLVEVAISEVIYGYRSAPNEIGCVR